jgi:flagellar hook assembly protein FlgD
MHFAYALHEGASVSFDVLDMAGRVVSRLEPGEKAAGEWSEAWRATDGAGQALHAGIYFVRMRTGGRVIGTRKITLLE